MSELDFEIEGYSHDDILQEMEEISGLGRGQLRQNPRARNFAKKVAQPASRRIIPTTNLSAKAEFEKRLPQVKPEIRSALKEGKLQLVDSNIYSIKDMAETKSLELMSNSDDRVEGKTNLNARKLEAGTAFCITAIQLLGGAKAAGTDAATVSFDEICAAVANGEFKLEHNNKVLIPKTSCEVFRNGNSTLPKGYWKLDNPKMLDPQLEIVPELKLPINTPANYCVKIILHGAITEKS